MEKLAGKVALVTGASHGIRRAIAERLARKGALVAVHYRSNEAAAREVVDGVEADGGSASAFSADLARSTAWPRCSGRPTRRCSPAPAKHASTSW